MKILLVADVEEPYIWDHFDKERFSNIDLIISCGDLKAAYLSFLVTMIKAPLYYVPGNHDKSYINNPPGGCECINNKLVIYNGIKILGLGGSLMYNKGEFQYTEKQMRKRIRKLAPKIWLHKGFDILVTHAPAYGLGDGYDICHTGFQSFRGLLNKYSPKYFFYGHNHLVKNIDPRIIKYKDSVLVNAYGYYILEY